MLQIKIFDLNLKNPDNYNDPINQWLASLGEDVELIDAKYTTYTWRDDDGSKSPYMVATFIYKTKPV